MKSRTFATVTGLLAAAALLLLARAGHTDGFVVLVNAANPVASLSRSELKKAITGGTKQWGSGAVVQLGVIPADAPETQFLGSLTDMSSRDLLARIQEQVFKGEMRRPTVLRSSADCVALVRGNPGAICVASAAAGVPPEAHVVSIH